MSHSWRRTIVTIVTKCKIRNFALTRLEKAYLSSAALHRSKEVFVRHHLWGDYLTREKDPEQEDERRAELARLQASRYADDAHRFRKYGLTVVGYQRLLAQQNGVCAICREPEREERSLSVDHCHRTGRVRSLLCGGCNKAIGFLRESPLLARAAATYLEQQLTKEFTGE